MAVLLRLILAALLALGVAVSHAAVCTEYRVIIGGITGDWKTSAADACTDVAAKATADAASCGSSSPYAGEWFSTCPGWTSQGIVADQCRTSKASPYGVRIGAPPIIENWGVATRDVDCPIDVCGPLAGSPYNGLNCNNTYGCKVYETPGAVGSQRILCDAPANGDGKGCAVVGNVDMKGTYGGKAYVWLSGLKYLLGECTLGVDGMDSAVTPSNNPGGVVAPPLPPGKCPGTVNGVEVVVDCGTTEQTSVTDSTPNTTTSTTTVNPDGTKTTTSIACEGNTCTKTTVTTTSVGGSATSTTSSLTGDKGSICKDYPGLSICANSAFAGTCDGGFTCTGDAAQCATAKAVNDDLCIAKKLTDGFTTEAVIAARAFMNGTGELDPKTEGGGARSVTMSGRLENVANPYSESCPSDVVFIVMAHEFAIPLAANCWALQMMGVLLHLSTLLYATMFVIRGV